MTQARPDGFERLDRMEHRDLLPGRPGRVSLGVRLGMPPHLIRRLCVRRRGRNWPRDLSRLAGTFAALALVRRHGRVLAGASVLPAVRFRFVEAALEVSASTEPHCLAASVGAAGNSVLLDPQASTDPTVDWPRNGPEWPRNGPENGYSEVFSSRRKSPICRAFPNQDLPGSGIIIRVSGVRVPPPASS